MRQTIPYTILTGSKVVQLKEFPFTEPGYSEVLIQAKDSTICGSDIRAIYHEHVGKGSEGYQGVITGLEPCGKIIIEGTGLNKEGKND